MKIAVINETSAGDKNKDIMAALDDTGHEIINCGMKEKGAAPELQYTHTGLMAALLLNAGRADFVIGGCGTGQGFLTSVMQYPGVVCGHILSPLDAWLFARINGGNCISLALNQGYGWAGDVNLQFVVERLFSVEFGSGYPSERKVPQGESRRILSRISAATHRSMAEILPDLPDQVVGPVLSFPGFLDVLDVPSVGDEDLKRVLTAMV